MALQFQFISPAYFKFISTSQQADGLEGLFIFADEVFSNIEGGYGLVAGVNDTTLILT